MSAQEATNDGNTVATSVRNRGHHKRVARSNVVPHGHAAPEVCDRIFRNVLQSWGFTSSSEEERDEVLGGIVEALSGSTSIETDYTQVLFTVEGQQLSVFNLVDECIHTINSPNPLRSFIRGFRNGDIAARISDFLGTEENLKERQRAVAKYGAVLTDAYLCFDIADVLMQCRAVSFTERRKIDAFLIYATKNAREAANGRGMSQPTHDVGGGAVGGKPMGTGAGSDVMSITPQAVFPSIR